MEPCNVPRPSDRVEMVNKAMLALNAKILLNAFACIGVAGSRNARKHHSIVGNGILYVHLTHMLIRPQSVAVKQW